MTELNGKALRRQITAYLIMAVDDHIEILTGEANTTAMAEDAIDALAGDDWKTWHEDGHPVWDIAVDVADATGHGITI